MLGRSATLLLVEDEGVIAVEEIGVFVVLLVAFAEPFFTVAGFVFFVDDVGFAVMLLPLAASAERARGMLSLRGVPAALVERDIAALAVAVVGVIVPLAVPLLTRRFFAFGSSSTIVWLFSGCFELMCFFSTSRRAKERLQTGQEKGFCFECR